jgi:Smg protein
MKGRIFDVVAYITQRCHEQGDRVTDPVELRDELLDAGYEEDEVERALVWLDRLGRDGIWSGEWLAAPSAAQRVPDEQEARKISAAARGYLLRLERMGILEPAMREAVYERALALDVPVLEVEEVRLLVALLFESRPATDRRLVAAILEDELELLAH